MGLNRQLVASIKQSFAAKSSAQLQEIVRLNDHDRWSAEAFVAARELLSERAAGQTAEPRVPEGEVQPPSVEEHLDDLFSLATSLLGFEVPLASVGPVPGGPVPFGSGLAWFAVETTDTVRVWSALGLHEAREVSWEEGVAAARRGSVFVTPPLGDWTLAASAAFVPPAPEVSFARPLIERLSDQFRDAQYFCAHAGAGAFVCARAQRGRFVRGFGRSPQARWDEGARTKAEARLGFGAVGSSDAPTEENVFQLAALWSVDPTALDDHFREPAHGLCGDLRTCPAPPWSRR